MTENGEPRCDFCYDVDPQWRYTSREFDLAMVNLDTLDTEVDRMCEHWLACWRCHTLISMNDRVGLLGRVSGIHEHLFPDADPTAMGQMIKLMQDSFFAGLTGLPVRV